MKPPHDPSKSSKPTIEQAPVPKGRLARLGRVTALATSIAGGVVANGAKQLLKGQRPKLNQLLLTPANARKLANQLAQLRGAAMKLGQLLSMDAGDFLPPELADILARLRQDAQSMPQQQLEQALVSNWGPQWQSQFRYFSMVPMAAASIGQVHEAVGLDGQRLAVKIQYPGVKDSINSDIDNVAALFRLTGLIPDTQDIRNLLEEAKLQLHEEADYLREAQCQRDYAAKLGNDTRYALPQPIDHLCTPSILVMTYQSGVPVESLVDSSPAVRQHVAELLFELMFRELFEFQLIQTDPNFANYRYNTATGQLVLLDFGATRAMPSHLVQCYAQVVVQAWAGQREGLRQQAYNIGYLAPDVPQHHQNTVLNLMQLACEPVMQQGPYAFGQTDLAQRIRVEGMSLAEGRDFWQTPPVDSIFLHRKLGGVFLLASRFKAAVDVGQHLRQVLQQTGLHV